MKLFMSVPSELFRLFSSFSRFLPVRTYHLLSSHSMFGRVYAFCVRHPYVSCLSINVVRYFVGDLIVQFPVTSERRASFDEKRTAIFTVFGFYAGTMSYALVSWIYPWLVRTFGLPPMVFVVVELLFVMPILYFPVWYFVKHWGETQLFDPGMGLRMAVENRDADLKATIFFWGPALSICFSLVSPPMRGVFNAVIGFGWVVVFSLMSGVEDNSPNKLLYQKTI